MKNLNTIIEDLENLNSQYTQLESGEVEKLLNKIFGIVWIECCYDPKNDSTREFAERLLPSLERLQELLKFKK